MNSTFRQNIEMSGASIQKDIGKCFLQTIFSIDLGFTVKLLPDKLLPDKH